MTRLLTRASARFSIAALAEWYRRIIGSREATEDVEDVSYFFDLRSASSARVMFNSRAEALRLAREALRLAAES